MLITKCPLRISIAGGSTDLFEFVEKYKHGSVISFPCNLYTYITLHENNRNKYIINYTKNEEVSRIEEIQNELVREVLTYFQNNIIKQKIPFITISFKSDIYSVGSGLASSSSYLIALIKAVSMFTKQTMTNIDICCLALKLERNFNPMTGYQDSYGCGMPSFKRMYFMKDVQTPKFFYYPTEMLNKYYMSLVYTGISRKSTNVLKSVDIDKSFKLLEMVDNMHDAIENENHEIFIKTINRGWDLKKETSNLILNHDLNKLEQKIVSLIDKKFDGIKLNGAGGGGYFLIFQNKDKTSVPLYDNQEINREYNIKKLLLDQDSIKGIKF